MFKVSTELLKKFLCVFPNVFLIALFLASCTGGDHFRNQNLDSFNAAEGAPASAEGNGKGFGGGNGQGYGGFLKPIINQVIFPREKDLILGDVITIFGANFFSGITITVSGVLCSPIVLVDSEKLSCTLTAGIADFPEDVIIYAPNGVKTTYQPPAAVSVDAWTPMSTVGQPSIRKKHLAVWTGSHMIVWGGDNDSNTLNDGGIYDPVSDSWFPMDNLNAPSPRLAIGVFTNNQLVVLGGGSGNGSVPIDGGRYDLGTGKWLATSTLNAPLMRSNYAPVWNGSHVFVWGGIGGANTGAAYNPTNDSWTTLPQAPLSPRSDYAAVAMTGGKLFIWGGIGGGNQGAIYDPQTASWANTNMSGAPRPLGDSAYAWTGSKVIVWGGYCSSPSSYCNEGGIYNPATSQWQQMTTQGAPIPRRLLYNNAGVWTGSRFLVWGGVDTGGGGCNTGGQYDLAHDSWSAISPLNVPEPRAFQSTVWTGSSMLIWGGHFIIYPLAGGIYQP